MYYILYFCNTRALRFASAGGRNAFREGSFALAGLGVALAATHMGVVSGCAGIAAISYGPPPQEYYGPISRIQP